jgi:Domain of unknown function (DUF4189)
MVRKTHRPKGRRLLSAREILGTFAATMWAPKRKQTAMRTVRSIAIGVAAAIVTSVIAMAPLRCAAAADSLRRFDMAQTSLGGSDDMQPAPQPPPSPPPRAPAPSPRDRTDFIPPTNEKPQAQPDQSQPDSPQAVLWGAIAFTADGSYWSAWKQPSKGDAEALVAKQCSALGHGGCQVASFSGQECGGLATFLGRRWKLSYTAGGDTYPEAQRNAMARCNADDRTRNNCQIRNVTCADGR